MKTISARVVLCLNFCFAIGAFASVPVESVPGLDEAREGDLASKTVDYFLKYVSTKKCESLGDSDQKEVTEVKSFKMASYSLIDKPDHNTIFTASYLVVKYCFMGTTYAGAYRELNESVIVEASRDTPENGLNVVESFRVIRSIDSKTLHGEQ